MINDVDEPAAPTPPPATAEPQPKAPLLILAGDDDLVCVDDLCLPADVRETRP